MATTDGDTPPTAHTDVDALLARPAQTRSEEFRLVWRRFVALEAVADQRSAPVLANVVALLAFDDDADLVTAASLAADLGGKALARMQLHILRKLGDSRDRPLASRLYRRLRAEEAHERLGTAVVSMCRDAAAYLLVEDVELDTPVGARHLRSRGQLLRLMVEGALDQWRPFAAAVVSAPWGPHIAQMLDLAAACEHPGARDCVERLVAVTREITENRERRQVAEQVRQLVQLSGLQQREFAALVGTSPSRLSTYVSGKVTPSAAMMVRMVRVAGTSTVEFEKSATA